jgi:GNAT superfamily N-acetyltransferase
VFREFPYLYEGTAADEASYLESYIQSPRSVVVLARDAEQIVGAATAMPLTDHGEAVAPPVVQAGFDPERVFYFGESVLRASYRGRGIGHAFFDHREAAARACGFETATFCAVSRPSDHPDRPPQYVPHDAFWTKRGYLKRPDITAQFAWRDLGDAHESRKSMVFWIKRVSP